MLLYGQIDFFLKSIVISLLYRVIENSPVVYQSLKREMFQLLFLYAKDIKVFI